MTTTSTTTLTMQRNLMRPTERQVDIRGAQLLSVLKRCKDIDAKNQTLPAELLTEITPKYGRLREVLRTQVFPTYFSTDLEIGDSHQFAVEAKLEDEYPAERLAMLHVLFYKLTPAELLNHLRASMSRLVDTYQSDDVQLELLLDMISDDGYPKAIWFDTWLEWLATGKFELPTQANAASYVSYRKTIMTSMSAAGGVQDLLRTSVNAQTKDPSILIGSLIPKKQCVAVKDASDGGYMIQQLEQVFYLMCQRPMGEHRDELVKTVTTQDERVDFFKDVTFADGFDVTNFLDTTMLDKEYTIESVDLLRTCGANHTPISERAIGIIEAGKSVPTLALVACKDPCKDAGSPDVWYACNVSFMYDEEEKVVTKHTVNTTIKSGEVSHWSMQALMFHRLMNKASMGDTPDLHTYVNMSDEDRKKYAHIILEVCTESYNAYQHGKQSKEIKKLFDRQDKIIKLGSEDSNFLNTKEGETAVRKYDTQDLCVKSMMQNEFPLGAFMWNGSSTLTKASEQSKAAVVLSLKQSAVCDDLAKAEWLLNYTIDTLVSATVLEKNKIIADLQAKIDTFERQADDETTRLTEVTANLKAKEAVIAELVDKLAAAEKATDDTLTQATRLENSGSMDAASVMIAEADRLGTAAESVSNRLRGQSVQARNISDKREEIRARIATLRAQANAARAEMLQHEVPDGSSSSSSAAP